MCSINEPLLKVPRLVGSDKLAMGYFNEGMDSANKTIWSYYVGKGIPIHNIHMMLWDLIDTRWTEMLHRPIRATALFLNPTFSYKCKFDFDEEVLEGIIKCINRMVPNFGTRTSVTREMEMHREATRLFGYADAIHARTILTPSK